MNAQQKRQAAIFNEWAKRYAEDPDSFSNILDADGRPAEDYGEQCAMYFDDIAQEMDAKGLLPIPAESA